MCRDNRAGFYNDSPAFDLLSFRHDEAALFRRRRERDAFSGFACELELLNGVGPVRDGRSRHNPNGFKVLFAKENGEWKMTNQSPTFDSMKPPAK